MSEEPSQQMASARPQKPDQEAYKKALAEKDKELDSIIVKIKEVNAKIDVATGNTKSSPVAQRRRELLNELGEIRQKQGGAKESRMGKLDQIKKLDERLKAKLNEQKAARSKMNFKSEAELDAEIKRLDDEVNSGKLRLADERRFIDDISRYKKLKKSFSHLAAEQKEIDKLRADIADIKQSMDNPEQKALSDRYTQIQTEIDSLKAQQDEAYNGLRAFRDEKNRLQKDRNECQDSIRKIKDDFYAQRRAFKEWEDELWRKKRERREQQDAQRKKEERLAAARERLDEASEPVYLEEIRRAENLWHFFDPSHEVEKKSSIKTDSGLRATSQRTVDDSAFKGMKAIKKDEANDDFVPSKKGKKGKKAGSSAASDKFNCPPAIMEDCAFLAVPVPASKSEVPSTIEKIKEKLEFWRTNQEAETQKNIEKAKKKLAQEEEDAQEASNGGKSVTEATKGVEAVSLEDGPRKSEEARE